MNVLEGEGVELFKEQAEPVKAIFGHEGRWAQGALLDPLSWEQGVVGAALERTHTGTAHFRSRCSGERAAPRAAKVGHAYRCSRGPSRTALQRNIRRVAGASGAPHVRFAAPDCDEYE